MNHACQLAFGLGLAGCEAEGPRDAVLEAAVALDRSDLRFAVEAPAAQQHIRNVVVDHVDVHGRRLDRLVVREVGRVIGHNVRLGDNAVLTHHIQPLPQLDARRVVDRAHLVRLVDIVIERHDGDLPLDVPVGRVEDKVDFPTCLDLVAVGMPARDTAGL